MSLTLLVATAALALVLLSALGGSGTPATSANPTLSGLEHLAAQNSQPPHFPTLRNPHGTDLGTADEPSADEGTR